MIKKKNKKQNNNKKKNNRKYSNKIFYKLLISACIFCLLIFIYKKQLKKQNVRNTIKQTIKREEKKNYYISYNDNHKNIPEELNSDLFNKKSGNENINKILDFFNKRYIKSYEFNKSDFIEINYEKKNVFLITEKKYNHVETIKKYNDNILNLSNNNIQEIDYSEISSINNDILNSFDRFTELFKDGIIIITYAIAHSLSLNRLVSFNYFLNNYKGKKILIVQDEYYHTKFINDFINICKINIVFTCSPNIDSLKKIYNNVHGDVIFINVLTGYTFKNKLVSIKDKETDIFYRGRKLHPYYGILGFQKFEIGEVMKKYAKDLVIDIECENKKRIYEGWLETLSKSKITLATPSGSNILRENDYELHNFNKKYNIPKHYNIIPDDMEYNRDIYDKMFKEIGCKEVLNFGQVSPKMFEAISVGTVLVMYEGDYNGILKPDVHYIELKADHSNIDSVIDKIKDNNYLQGMANKSYKDIIDNGNYSYENFVKILDYLIFYLQY